jgi:scyllo-inositol 2-dehydrogenase (NADP+)
MAGQQMIAVGLIGYGMAAKVFHQPLIESVEGLKIVAALRRTSAAGAAFPLISDPEEFLALPIQLAVITTPNETHFELAKLCIQAGLHVVIDKPFTVTSAEARELIDLAQKKHRLLTVFHNRRYDGDFLTIQQLLREGTLGRLVSFESSFDRFRPELKTDAWREQPQPGSGILYDLGPHLIDQALVLFGSPRAVFASVRRERGGSADDAFDVFLIYRDHKVLLRASMLASIARPRFLVQGTNGSYAKYDVDEQERLLKSGVRPLDHDWNKSINQPGTLVLREGDQVVTRELPTPLGDYRRFYAEVRDAIDDNRPPTVPPEAGLRTVQLIEAACKSSAEDRVVAFNTME